MITLTEATLTEVRENWSAIETALYRIITKAETDFLPVDVFVLLVNKNSFLHWVSLDGKNIGWVILSIAHTSYNMARRSLFIDHINITTNTDIWVGFDKAIEDLARQANCEMLEFNSPRAGFEKTLTKLDWSKASVIYHRIL